jgi:hypothetical protein
LSYQGQIYVAIALPPPINTVLGGLLMHYKCHLFIPNFETDTPLSFASTQVTNAQAPVGNDANSILGKLVSGVGAISTALESDPKYRPILNAAGQAAIRLAEGVFRASAAGVANAGTPSFNTPVLLPLQPQPAPAPQPGIQLINSRSATAVGAPLFTDVLLNVPVGGADFFWNANAAASTIDSLKFNIDRIQTGYWDGALAALVV